MIIALGSAVVLILLLSATLSALEAAAFSVSESNLRAMRDEGYAGAGKLSELRAAGPGAQSALLFLHMLLNVAAAGILVALATQRWGLGGAAVALPVATVGAVLLAEILPRMLAARKPVRLALGGAGALVRLVGLLRPLLAPITGLEQILERTDSSNGHSREERELREVAQVGREEGVVEEEENRLIERAFRLDDLTAWDVMRPRVEIFAWQDSLRLEEIIGQVRTVPFSRVPVYGDSIDNVTGIVYVREVYQAYVSGRTEVALSALAREPLFVPGSLPLTTLLRYFQARRIHMGVVADEFGGTDGIVTMEDVLEELVGEIHDETDTMERPVFKISRSEIFAAGNAELREINYAINVTLPHFEHRSLNGWLLEETGRVPGAGEVIHAGGVSIEILDATDTQVLRTRIRKGATGSEDGEAA